MHLLKITLFIFCLVPFSLSAQKQLIGQVQSTEGEPLIAATVMLLQAKDSFLLSFATTEAEGQFRIKGKQEGDFILRLSYVGYVPLDYPVSIHASGPNPVDLGTLEMEPMTQELKEVLVKSEKIPMQISKDTIIYNADAFQTAPGSDVETLLKKLPGIDVENDGTIKAYGEDVNRVFVDGKEFFGSDPKVATKNLPAEAVDKVEVYDRASDTEEFTGVKDGQDSKAINLKLKDDHKRGVFGRAEGGYGDQGRFRLKTNLNRFGGGQQISLLGMGNNINESGFGIQDYINFNGGMSAMGGGLQIRKGSLDFPLDLGTENGFNTNWAGGLNFNQEFKPGSDIQSSYMYNRSDKDITQTSTKQNFAETGNFREEFLNQSNLLSEAHRVNFTLDHKLDSLQEVTYRTAYSRSRSRNQIYEQNEVFDDRDSLSTSLLRQQFQNGTQDNWTNELSYRKRFRKPGKYLSISANFDLLNRDQDQDLSALRTFFREAIDQDTINQKSQYQNLNLNGRFNLTYHFPLAKGLYMAPLYNFQALFNDVNQETVDVIGDEEIPNPVLTNAFESLNLAHEIGFRQRWIAGPLNLQWGLKGQITRLTGLIEQVEEDIDNSYFNLLPSLDLEWEYGASRSLNLNYETSVRIPQVRELQSVIDNSDPLNIYVGNPQLKPEYNHQLMLRQFMFSQFSQTSFFLNLSYNYTRNKIVNSQSIDPNFVRLLQPVNTAYEQGVNGSLHFGKGISALKMRLSVVLTSNFSKGFNVLNETTSAQQFWQSGGTLKIGSRRTEVIEYNLGFRLTYNQQRYDQEDLQEQNYWEQLYFGDLSVNIKDRVRLSTNLDYTFYNGLSDGFNQEIPIWSANLSVFLMKSRQLELNLGITDILNRNTGISRTTALNYILDREVNTLSRYIMFTLRYKIFTKGAMPGPGMEIKVEKR